MGRISDDDYDADIASTKVSSPLYEKLSLSTQWPLDDLLAYASIKETNQDVVVQYLDSLPFGFRMQYRGDKVCVYSSILQDNELTTSLV